jgi:phosphatidylglycerol:prolipoprotein diacylglycerol transferase
LIGIGFLFAWHCCRRDAQLRGLDPQYISRLAFIALFLGIIGARLLFVIMYNEYFIWEPLGWIAFWRGGLVFQGGLPLAIICVWYGFRIRGISFWFGADTVIPYLPLAQGFGRIGCFLNGCCYGIQTSLPWGVRFPRVPWDFAHRACGSPAYLDHCSLNPTLCNTSHWSYPVHPTQLYCAAGLFFLCGILVILRKRWLPFVGFTLPLYLILYSLGRFIVEFFRGDHNPLIGALSVQQELCLVCVTIGATLFAFMQYRAQKSVAGAP